MKVRAWAYGVSLVAVVIVASPLLGAFANDSFPISTYPMFANARPREALVSSAVMTWSDGTSAPVPPRRVANDEVIQAFETIRQAIRQGPAATQALCERIAARVASDGAETVSIVTGAYDAVAYFEGEKEPSALVVHTSCEVDRP
jgi:hypothetical protein